MGFERSRFVDENVDEELICSICSCVLEDPLQIPACEHEFCGECIKEWLDQQQTCPVCRHSITVNELKPASRILRNFLSRLNIVCENAQFGCGEVFKFDALIKHQQNCEFSPTRPILCEKGCALMMPKNEMEDHNCIKELRSYFDKEIQKLEQKYNEMKSYAETLSEYLKQTLPRSLPSTSSHSPSLFNWYSSLARARVLRWGGLISTPDEANQECIKKTLIRLGCSLGIVNELIENSHERNWPPGLSTLEIRQMNRAIFENYLVRKLPNLQVVVVMGCENQHMQEDMIMEPGIVMIFAHGVEEI